MYGTSSFYVTGEINDDTPQQQQARQSSSSSVRPLKTNSIFSVQNLDDNTCVDKQVCEGDNCFDWYDKDGSPYDCDWYVQYNSSYNACYQYGNQIYENFGMDASEACCICGGGDTNTTAGENSTAEISATPTVTTTVTTTTATPTATPTATATTTTTTATATATTTTNTPTPTTATPLEPLPVDKNLTSGDENDAFVPSGSGKIMFDVKIVDNDDLHNALHEALASGNINSFTETYYQVIYKMLVGVEPFLDTYLSPYSIEVATPLYAKECYPYCTLDMWLDPESDRYPIASVSPPANSAAAAVAGSAAPSSNTNESFAAQSYIRDQEKQLDEEDAWIRLYLQYTSKMPEVYTNEKIAKRISKSMGDTVDMYNTIPSFRPNFSDVTTFFPGSSDPITVSIGGMSVNKESTYDADPQDPGNEYPTNDGLLMSNECSYYRENNDRSNSFGYFVPFVSYGLMNEIISGVVIFAVIVLYITGAVLRLARFSLFLYIGVLAATYVDLMLSFGIYVNGTQLHSACWEYLDIHTEPHLNWFRLIAPGVTLVLGLCCIYMYYRIYIEEVGKKAKKEIQKKDRQLNSSENIIRV